MDMPGPKPLNRLRAGVAIALHTPAKLIYFWRHSRKKSAMAHSGNGHA